MMALARAKTLVLADPVAVFEARCTAKAALVASCDEGLQSAVDELQAAAIASGLVKRLGQDAVQEIMSRAFAKIPRPGELEDAFAALADCIEEMPRHREGAARSTVEALVHSLRDFGEVALADPITQRRLTELSPNQLRQFIQQLDRTRPNFPAITDGLVLLLGGLL
jgi:hypothetical protein